MKEDEARRHVEERDDGSRLEYSIPAGASDEDAAAEIARWERRIELGYVARLKFHDGIRIDVRWLVRQPRVIQRATIAVAAASRALPRALDKFSFTAKCLALDLYWLARGVNPHV